MTTKFSDGHIFEIIAILKSFLKNIKRLTIERTFLKHFITVRSMVGITDGIIHAGYNPALIFCLKKI